MLQPEDASEQFLRLRKPREARHTETLRLGLVEGAAGFLLGVHSGLLRVLQGVINQA